MADNNKDDIEILDFVDNELMEISQEELDNMQSAFDELEASGSDDSDDDASGSVDADSMVVQPKSVDTRFSEPVDDVDLEGLDLGDVELEEAATEPAVEAPVIEEAAEEVAEPVEEIKELSLDSSDVMADFNDVDAMLQDALGDLDNLDDFDANELSADLDESLLKEPEGSEDKTDDAVEAATEEKAEEPETAEESAKGVELNEEGEPILDLNGVPVDEEDISEISTILSKPDNNDLVNDNLMEMLDTAQEEKEQREYGENLPEIGETTYKTVVDEEEAIEEGSGSMEIVPESAAIETEDMPELPPMDDVPAEPKEEVKEEVKEEPEEPKKEKKKKEKKPKKEPVEEDLDDDLEGKKKMSLWERIMAFLFESDEEENEEGAEGEAVEGAEGEGGEGAPAKKGKKEKKKKEKKDKKGKKGKDGAEDESGEGEESPKKKSKKGKGGDEEGDGEEGEGKKKKKKEKKPKKEKNLEEELKPRQKGISNKAVAAILLVCLSIAAVIVVLCYFGPRKLAINKANYDLYDGEYQEAALTLYGMNLNENDTLVYRKASLLNAVNTKLDQYDKFMAIKREDKALDALFKTITYCDTKKVEADNVGVAEEVAIVRNAALSILSDKYGVTEEQAEEICQMRPVYYTSAIESIMRGLAFDAFDPLDEESQQRAYDAQLESITGGEESGESEEAEEAPSEELEDPLEGEPGIAPAPSEAGEGNGEGEVPDLLPEETTL